MISRHEIFAFIRRRLDRTSWLGLGLTLSVGVAMAAIWAFASLLDAVLDNATLVRLDLAVAALVHATETPAGTSVMRLISNAGSPPVMTVLAVAVGLELLRRRRPRFLTVWAAAFAGAALLERTLKAVVHRHRPMYASQSLNGFSFPSGHATLSFVGCAMLVYAIVVLGSAHGARRVWTVSLATAFVILVGVSRVYLSAHYPSDVLGGWTVGAAWTALCIAASETWRSRVEAASS